MSQPSGSEETVAQNQKPLFRQTNIKQKSSQLIWRVLPLFGELTFSSWRTRSHALHEN